MGKRRGPVLGELAASERDRFGMGDAQVLDLESVPDDGDAIAARLLGGDGGHRTRPEGSRCPIEIGRPPVIRRQTRQSSRGVSGSPMCSASTSAVCMSA